MLRFHAQGLVVVSASLLAQFLDFGGLGRSGAPCGVEELLAGIGVKIPALRAPPIWSARAPVVPWEVWSQGHRRP